jgi:hypothetical protein
VKMGAGWKRIASSDRLCISGVELLGTAITAELVCI